MKFVTIHLLMCLKMGAPLPSDCESSFHQLSYLSMIEVVEGVPRITAFGDKFLDDVMELVNRKVMEVAEMIP